MALAIALLYVIVLLAIMARFPAFIAIFLLLCVSACVAKNAFAAEAPKGMVAAYGKIDSDAGPIAELSGFVPANACRIHIPPMWRPDKGYVRFSYRCTK